MRRLVTALLFAFMASAAWGFDLGGLIEQATKPKPPAQEGAAQSAPSQETAKQVGITGLLGLVSETPVEEELAIGREITGRLLGASALVDDVELQRYINRVGKWVALQSGRDELTWHFGVVESGDINAFAMPGGYILVTRGLYQRLANEAELAGVLAHEIGHVIKRHHLKLLKKGQAIEAGGGLLQSKVAGDEKGEAIGRMIGSGAEIMARGLDKAAEHEADRIGVVLATRAGYDSYGLPAVLQEIGHVGADDSSVGLLFKTHPHPDVRLARLDEAMGDRFIDIQEGQGLPGRLYRLK
jgi:predicted Zn-dependent protease